MNAPQSTCEACDGYGVLDGLEPCPGDASGTCKVAGQQGYQGPAGFTRPPAVQGKVDWRSLMATPAVCDALIVGAVREALDEFEMRMNGLVYNGAGDPEQEFYNHGVAPWLEREMQRVRRTLTPPGQLTPPPAA